MIKLRGHHFVCINFLKPEALSGPFASIAPKIEELRSRLEKGETAIVVQGGDELCEPCPFLKGSECEYGEEVREMDERALELLGLKVGEEVQWAKVKEVVSSIIDQWRAEYCEECELRGACSS